MTIESGKPQETPESWQIDKTLKVKHMTDKCPACSHRWIDTWYREGEIGFKDVCDTCQFEGISLNVFTPKTNSPEY